MILSEDIVTILLDGPEVLLEDRIDDLMRTYGQALTKVLGAGHDWTRTPAEELRKDIENFAQFDPHPRKKYLPWIVKQIAQGKLEPNDANLDHLRDQLRSYERLIAIPSFEGNRDIFAYDWPAFDETITSNMDIRSQSEKERAAKEAKKHGLKGETGQAGVTKIAEFGNLSLLEIKDAVSLSWWSWKAYDRDFNPNWEHKTIPMPPPEKLQNPDLHDGFWCVRYPTYGLDYIEDEPTKAFYLVLKNGGPYVGILLSGGQWKNLMNKGIDLGVAEEIYPVVQGIISQFKKAGNKLGYEGEVFENLRFVHGEVQPGEIFEDVDLSGSSVAVLPADCTFNTLTIERTQVRIIPPGTKAKNIKAAQSAVREVAPDVRVENLFDLSYTQVAGLPPGMSLNTLRLIGSPIAQLPDNLDVRSALHIEGTQITELPNTLKIGESMTWSEPLGLPQVKGAFYNKCMPDMYRSFVEKIEANPKFFGKGDKEKQAAWKRFQAKLWDYFQNDPTIDKNVKAVFVYHKPEPPGKEE